MKALIVSPMENVYNTFLRVNRLNPQDYKRISKPEDIYGYENILLIVLGALYSDFSFDNYLVAHNIDVLYYNL